MAAASTDWDGVCARWNEPRPADPAAIRAAASAAPTNPFGIGGGPPGVGELPEFSTTPPPLGCFEDHPHLECLYAALRRQEWSLFWRALDAWRESRAYTLSPALAQHVAVTMVATSTPPEHLYAFVIGHGVDLLEHAVHGGDSVLVAAAKHGDSTQTATMLFEELCREADARGEAPPMPHDQDEATFLHYVRSVPAGDADPLGYAARTAIAAIANATNRHGESAFEAQAQAGDFAMCVALCTDPTSDYRKALSIWIESGTPFECEVDYRAAQSTFVQFFHAAVTHSDPIDDDVVPGVGYVTMRDILDFGHNVPGMAAILLRQCTAEQIAFVVAIAVDLGRPCYNDLFERLWSHRIAEIVTEMKAFSWMDDSRTMLHDAVEHSLPMTIHLLSVGLDPLAVASDGQTPRDLARQVNLPDDVFAVAVELADRDDWSNPLVRATALAMAGGVWASDVGVVSLLKQGVRLPISFRRWAAQSALPKRIYRIAASRQPWWQRRYHAEAPTDVRLVVRSTLFCARRLDSSAAAGTGVVPRLPIEMWLAILGFLHWTVPLGRILPLPE